MASFTLTIPDAQLPRVRDALCAYIGLSGPDVTNANAKAGLVQAVKNIVHQQESLAAMAAAEASVPTSDPDVT